MEAKHRTMLKYKYGVTDFRTKTDRRGHAVYSPRTGRPIHYPIGATSGNLPKMRMSKYAGRSVVSLTPLETETLQMEKDLTEAGWKAYTIGIRLKSGETIEIPCILKTGAQGWADAMKIAHERIMKIDPDQVDEIDICDPSIGQVLHKLGHGAAGVVRRIARGVQKLPGITRRVYKFGRREAMKAAHEAGRVMALPSEIKEEYHRGLEERPGVPQEAPRRVLSPDEAARLVAEAVSGVPHPEVEELKYPIVRPAMPAVETYAQRVASQEAVETKLEKELRGLQRQVAREHAREELEKIAQRRAKTKRHVKSGPYSSANPLH
jgi:hypothetical protein